MFTSLSLLRIAEISLGFILSYPSICPRVAFPYQRHESGVDGATTHSLTFNLATALRFHGIHCFLAVRTQPSSRVFDLLEEPRTLRGHPSVFPP